MSIFERYCSTRLISLFSVPKDAPVAPSTPSDSKKSNGDDIANATVQEKLCLMCFESGATVRPCCNALYCDHCYTKNRMCPNCDAATRLEKMTGATCKYESTYFI